MDVQRIRLFFQRRHTMRLWQVALGALLLLVLALLLAFEIFTVLSQNADLDTAYEKIQRLENAHQSDSQTLAGINTSINDLQSSNAALKEANQQLEDKVQAFAEQAESCEALKDKLSRRKLP